MAQSTINKPTNGININPIFEELDVDKMEQVITLDDVTKEKILKKHRNRIAKKEVKNAEIKATIEGKELEQRLAAAKTGSWESALNEQKKQILKLVQYSFFGSIVFLFILPIVLSFLHAYSIASMASRLGSPFAPAYIIGFVFAGLGEGLMLGLVLQFAHRQAKYTMYSALSVIAIVTSVEIFKSGIEVLQLTDVVRVIGSLGLIPVIKSFAANIRDAAEKEGNPNKKLPFERQPEAIQNKIITDCIYLKGELDKFQAIPVKSEQRFNPTTGKTATFTKKERIYKINRFSFPEYSNATHTLEHSLKKVLVSYKVYTNICWKQLPSKNKNKKEEIDMTPLSEFLQTNEGKNPKKIANFLKKNLGAGAALIHVQDDLKKVGYSHLVDEAINAKKHNASVADFIKLLNGKPLQN